MKTKCSKCGNQTELSELHVHGECYDCKRLRDAEEEAYRISSQQLYDMATGDMLSTGIPGGLDGDMSTPL